MTEHLLRVALHALNLIPNTHIAHDDYRTTYSLAAAIERSLSATEAEKPTRTFALRAEAVACIWEAMLDLRLNSAPDTPLKRAIDPLFDSYGTAEMRHVAISLADTLLDVYEFIPADQQQELDLLPYDWCFVPMFLDAIDWSKLNVFSEYQGTQWAGEPHLIAAKMINAARSLINKRTAA